MNVGDYVRTNFNGEVVIRKVVDIVEDSLMHDHKLKFDRLTRYIYFLENDSDYKTSSNIIDLIEIGDYVNGCRVEGQDEDGWLYLDTLEEDECQITNLNDIKSIVTKEQFELMQYKVGD